MKQSYFFHFIYFLKQFYSQLATMKLPLSSHYQKVSDRNWWIIKHAGEQKLKHKITT